MKKHYASDADFNAAIQANTGTFPITLSGALVFGGTGPVMQYFSIPGGGAKTPDHRATS
jgi:hypothetical protein